MTQNWIKDNYLAIPEQHQSILSTLQKLKVMKFQSFNRFFYYFRTVNLS